MKDTRTDVFPGEAHQAWTVTVETLGSVHDRTDAHMSDPPADATGDTQPDGDGLNHPE
ncbi:hypothetical protein ACPA54_12945 [Uniformispora flossi]|uniref:hypothetical protein n=1 Tax=Uniformispora flossi TaxID=3390723 RepID=UPI003C2CBA2F